NVLYEIDGETALDLYKQYLGPYVNELPGSALLFPLSMRLDDSGKNLVRTILTIDEDKKTMTFAGNLPEGARVRLMKANFEKIIEGSSIAAAKSVETGQKQFPELAILISCVGRKLILQDRTSEEVQAARNI
ncbi:FIST C-terminal domain-containing protein, partial [Pseudoalteromonas sp. S408]|uniref:FIST signal transduction protein n=1 Tax=Pseudoalteromonas sp. S408 TaxID=2066519 RepID=UPI0012836229